MVTKSKKITVSIPLEPSTPTQRKIQLAQRPPNVVFTRRFNVDDVAQWKLAAERLGMSDTEFLERIMNLTADAVLGGKS